MKKSCITCKFYAGDNRKHCDNCNFEYTEYSPKYVDIRIFRVVLRLFQRFISYAIEAEHTGNEKWHKVADHIQRFNV